MVFQQFFYKLSFLSNFKAVNIPYGQERMNYIL
jgi:hypothetical protein